MDPRPHLGQNVGRAAAKPRGRPKRAPADAEVRQRLLRTGLIFLTQKGYSAVGLDEILREAGVPKGGFYHYFDSKADFGRALIDAYHAYFRDKLERCFSEQSLSPLGRLRAFVADAQAGMQRHDFTRGCLVGNLGQEMGALPPEFREKLVHVLEDWQSRTAACLSAAQAAGEIAAHHDPARLAAIFWIGWEGAVLRAKLERKPDPLTIFADGFFAMLN